ncbi:MAG: rod shape-determining protein MreD [Candidatus Omnitrophota bacterium]
MRKAAFFFLILIFGLIQATILNYFRIFLVKPDFLFVIIVIASLCFRPFWSVTFSIFAGFLKDVLGGSGAFGINTVLFPLWSLLVIRLDREVSIDHHLSRAVLILIVVFLNDLIVRLIFLSSGTFIPFRVFSWVIILESFYTALVSPLVFNAIHPLIDSED